MEKFLSYPTDLQRTILGELMMPNVSKFCADCKGDVAKITGMLIDFTVFQVEDILELLENPNDLYERIQEAQALILNSGSG